eukprot:655259-Hanusia_phi.AAC.1
MRVVVVDPPFSSPSISAGAAGQTYAIISACRVGGFSQQLGRSFAAFGLNMAGASPTCLQVCSLNVVRAKEEAED